MLTQAHPSYAHVDDLLGALNGSTSVPNGTLKTVFTLIDELRDSGAPQDVIRIVESLSAAVHKWEWALRLRDGERQAVVQDHIGALEKRWTHLKHPDRAAEDAPPLPRFRRRPSSTEAVASVRTPKQRRGRTASLSRVRVQADPS